MKSGLTTNILKNPEKLEMPRNAENVRNDLFTTEKIVTRFF